MIKSTHLPHLLFKSVHTQHMIKWNNAFLLNGKYSLELKHSATFSPPDQSMSAKSQLSEYGAFH